MNDLRITRLRESELKNGRRIGSAVGFNSSIITLLCFIIVLGIVWIGYTDLFDKISRVRGAVEVVSRGVVLNRISLGDNKNKLDFLWREIGEIQFEIDGFNKIIFREVKGITITAYTPSKDETDDTPWETASGVRLRPFRTAAVSRPLEKFLPLGSIIEIEGDLWRVEDRMNPRWEDFRIDIAVHTKAFAFDYGKRVRSIRIIGWMKLTL